MTHLFHRQFGTNDSSELMAHFLWRFGTNDPIPYFCSTRLQDCVTRLIRKCLPFHPVNLRLNIQLHTAEIQIERFLPEEKSMLICYFCVLKKEKEKFNFSNLGYFDDGVY